MSSEWNTHHHNSFIHSFIRLRMAHFADRKDQKKKGGEKKGMCARESKKERYECRWTERQGQGELGHNKLFNVNRNRKSTNRKTFIDFWIFFSPFTLKGLRYGRGSNAVMIGLGFYVVVLPISELRKKIQTRSQPINTKQ